MTVENILAMAAAGPGIYGIICWILRSFHARKVAKWIKEAHQKEWNSIHWLARRNPRAGIEVLISKGSISGPKVDEFLARDEYLEKATWIGLWISLILVSAIIVWENTISVLS